MKLVVSSENFNSINQQYLNYLQRSAGTSSERIERRHGASISELRQNMKRITKLHFERGGNCADVTSA